MASILIVGASGCGKSYSAQSIIDAGKGVLHINADDKECPFTHKGKNITKFLNDDRSKAYIEVKINATVDKNLEKLKVENGSIDYGVEYAVFDAFNKDGSKKTIFDHVNCVLDNLHKPLPMFGDPVEDSGKENYAKARSIADLIDVILIDTFSNLLTKAYNEIEYRKSENKNTFQLRQDANNNLTILKDRLQNLPNITSIFFNHIKEEKPVEYDGKGNVIKKRPTLPDVASKAYKESGLESHFSNIIYCDSLLKQDFLAHCDRAVNLINDVRKSCPEYHIAHSNCTESGMLTPLSEIELKLSRNKRVFVTDKSFYLPTYDVSIQLTKEAFCPISEVLIDNNLHKLLTRLSEKSIVQY